MRSSAFLLSLSGSLISLVAVEARNTPHWFKQYRSHVDNIERILSATPSLKSVSRCTGVAQPPVSALPTASLTGTPLPPPAPGLSVYHVAIGRGVQNYTCPSTSNTTATPTLLGAIATLFNVSCQASFSSSSLSTLPDLVAMTPTSEMGDTLFAATPDAKVSGHHFFPNPTTPVFNLNVADEKSLGVVSSKKFGSVPAPSGSGQGLDGSKAVPWLYLKASGGDSNEGGIKEIYRVRTAGGAAPPTCEEHMGQLFSMQYSAEYWFFA